MSRDNSIKKKSSKPEIYTKAQAEKLRRSALEICQRWEDEETGCGVSSFTVHSLSAWKYKRVYVCVCVCVCVFFWLCVCGVGGVGGGVGVVVVVVGAI
jgi:hypothetical protein